MMKHLLTAFAIFLVFAPAQSRAVEPLVLNTGTRAPYTTEDHKGFLDRLVEEVFERVGVKAEVLVYNASARAMEQANDGVDAGFAMRVKGLEKRYANMVRIPEKIIDNDFVALSKSAPFPTTDWKSLAGYDVAYILGWKIFERNLAGYANIVTPRNADQLIDLLRYDRVDLILYERWQGAWRAQNTGLKVSVHEPPLASVPMYMYLHKKHADLVEPVAEALRAMKADGAYDRIVAEVLAPLAAKP